MIAKRNQPRQLMVCERVRNSGSRLNLCWNLVNHLEVTDKH
jgi:hypothetical protein